MMTQCLLQSPSFNVAAPTFQPRGRDDIIASKRRHAVAWVNQIGQMIDDWPNAPLDLIVMVNRLKGMFKEPSVFWSAFDTTKYHIFVHELCQHFLDIVDSPCVKATCNSYDELICIVISLSRVIISDLRHV